MNAITWNVNSVYSIISNALEQREHLRQIVVSPTISNEIVLVAWLHTWKSFQRTVATQTTVFFQLINISYKHQLIETSVNKPVRSQMKGTFWQDESPKIQIAFLRSTERNKFKTPEVEKEEKTGRKKLQSWEWKTLKKVLSKLHLKEQVRTSHNEIFTVDINISNSVVKMFFLKSRKPLPASIIRTDFQ